MIRLARYFGRRLPLAPLALVLAVGALAAAGCDTYHYYDMDLVFGSAWVGGISSAGAAQLCRVNVTGADTHEFDINNCGIMSNNTNYPDAGKFEYATFADSGMLTFTVDAYNGTPYTAACLFGTGSTTVTASSTVTSMGMITINPMGTGCPNNQ